MFFWSGKGNREFSGTLELMVPRAVTLDMGRLMTIILLRGVS